MGPQFIRFDKYGAVGAHGKNTSERKRSMHGKHPAWATVAVN
jgi:hypothetical protein